jgi:hypothetical protein
LTHFDARPACASTGASALQLQPDFEAEPLEARQRGGLGVEQWVELLGDLGTHQIYHPKVVKDAIKLNAAEWARPFHLAPT